MDVRIVRVRMIGRDPGEYLLPDGRNATLSFLYTSFLFGSHQYSELSEAYEGIRRLDATEGSWACHVAEAVRQNEARKVLFVRFEDLVSSPEVTLKRMIRLVVDPARVTLKAARVALAGHDAEQAFISAGVPEGAKIVALGVHKLSEGEKVRVVEKLAGL
jgi:hypothetical protein